MSDRGSGRSARLARAEAYLRAYRDGAFPMDISRRGEVAFYVPFVRAVLPLDDRLHIPRSLRQRVRSGRFEVTCDRAFREVIRSCADTPRPGAWLCEEVIDTFITLHEEGHAHSIEAWRDGRLVGGLYGLAIGGAFCGESMFSRPDEGGTDASKVCLVHLVAHLRARGFTLLDSQILNDHMRQFRPLLVPHEAYLRLLEAARDVPVTWGVFDPEAARRKRESPCALRRDYYPSMTSSTRAFQRCINAVCAQSYPITSTLVACPACGNLLDVDYDWTRLNLPSWSLFEQRSSTRGPRSAAGTFPTTPSMLDFSGVWRFRELLPFYADQSRIVTIGEGRTNLQRADQLARVLGFDPAARNGAGGLYLQYEGFNPSGSFKDNGMTAAFTHAAMVGATRVACASTGNTSAALAVYASLLGVKCFVFIGEGKIAYGKLSQALDYGATTLQIAGDFDACLARIRHIAEKMPEVGVYLMNSVNPFRLEGQKAIMYRVLEGLDWQPPDWIIVPGGNLGNCSAFGKAFIELRALGLVKKVPRLAIIQAKGSRTLDRIVNELGVTWKAGERTGDGLLVGSWDIRTVDAEYARMDAANERARTIATAIEINRPVNLPKALRALHAMQGVVRSVTDEAIVEHKAMVGRYGLGCEPASAASVAGASMLLREGVIRPDERVVCVLTGHQLKDPDVTVKYHTAGATGAKLANAPIRVPDDPDAILRAMGVR